MGDELAVSPDTTEDLAEEIVGELDEHDRSWRLRTAATRVWEMAGDVHVDEVERTSGWSCHRATMRRSAA